MGSEAGEGHSGMFPSAPSAPGWPGVQAGWAASARPAFLCPAALDQTPSFRVSAAKAAAEEGTGTPKVSRKPGTHFMHCCR